ncbi:speriolin isoform X2 [Cavia porcellus]|uniref:speriolin isoform X2 n=1 Tax=Cavia porcellus TaxID=10141 RepID=UPI002FDFA798
MSLLSNYEGLRQQIERLVRENEELKKLVRLIRENQELRSAIKIQPGSINISAFANGLGEVATGPAQHQGIFLSPSPAAANEPVLEDVGLVALAPMVDMLSSSHLSPTAGSLTSPLTGPCNTLLPNPAPGSQSSQFSSILSGPLSSHLTGPMAVSPGATLASNLGMPSTCPMSSHLIGPMAVSPGTTLPGSLGLTSTGSLTPSSPLACPLAMSKSSPLMASPGPVAVSLSSPLLTSTPLSVSQNLAANPMSNLVLSEAPRLRLAEPLQGSPSGPYSSAGTGHAASSKVCTSHSPPRNPHTSPRTSSVPASVTDTRCPRTTETNRKNALELERKLTHRKSSKFPDGSQESKQLSWERLVGEIAFQLDRRILSSIFPERVRLYGFTVSNIPEKIIQASLNPHDHKLDEELCQTLTQRYVSIMNKLQSLGYNGRVHPALTEQLVNAYGILRERPEMAASEGGCYTVDFLQRVLVETVHPSMLTDALLLLSCLNQLAHDDGKPMFIW